MTQTKKHLTVAILGSKGSGKTSLAEALSLNYCAHGEDPLFAEEIDAQLPRRVRGMGITYTEVKCEYDGMEYTFVDCNQYSDWIKLLHADVFRFDYAILTVDARDGVSVQTREFLFLASKLHIPGMTALLTFRDQTDEEMDTLAVMQTEDLLSFFGYGDHALFYDVPKLYKAEGSYDEGAAEKLAAVIMEEVKTYAPEPISASEQPFLMAVEDVFSISSMGTVVAGSIERGTIRKGDTLEIVGGRNTGMTLTPSGIQIGRQLVEEASANDDICLMFRNISKDDIERGSVLAAPGTMRTSKFFKASVYVLMPEEGGSKQPLPSGIPVQFGIHTGTENGFVTLPEGMPFCMPGDYTEITGELLSHNVAMSPGTKVSVKDRNRTIALGVVIECQPAETPEEQEKRAKELNIKGVRNFNSKNYEEAVKCFREAADLGHPSAAYNLAIMYESGLGVEEDLEMAVYYLEQAADAGHEKAAEELAELMG